MLATQALLRSAKAIVQTKEANVQAPETQYSHKLTLLPMGELQPPDLGQRQDQNDEVERESGSRSPVVHSCEVDAATAHAHDYTRIKGVR